MYGSSLRMETERPRALRIRPMLAAVIPFPSEEVTPPVTKTYFDIGRAPPGVFRMLPKDGLRGNRWPSRGLELALVGRGNSAEPNPVEKCGDLRLAGLVRVDVVGRLLPEYLGAHAGT
jgi:hypothetical protein